MSLSLIRTEIKTILSGVTGVGTKVHDYQRWAKTWEDYLSFFKSNGLIKGWEITRRSTPETQFTLNSNLRTHTMVVRGYYSVDDSAATEKVFQDIIEAIAAAFKANPTLNGQAFSSDPLQVDSVGLAMFGSVLCHICELRLLVQEEVQR
ncbi:unnamed protein product [marine sediment metagenome]|uniref:Uncharacterized protein n=1 Tax=marine sediment metagenome TaxID=412755 RepID=X1VAK7_9ZZZZ